MNRIIMVLMGISGLALGIWLGFFVMLYGGIMAAVSNWGIDNAAVAWGIIRAIFFKVGIAAGVLIGQLGMWCFDD